MDDNNYHKVIEDSQYFENCEQILEYCKHVYPDDEYLIKTLENTIENGKKIRKRV